LQARDEKNMCTCRLSRTRTLGEEKRKKKKKGSRSVEGEGKEKKSEGPRANALPGVRASSTGEKKGRARRTNPEGESRGGQQKKKTVYCPLRKKGACVCAIEKRGGAPARLLDRHQKGKKRKTRPSRFTGKRGRPHSFVLEVLGRGKRTPNLSRRR